MPWWCLSIFVLWEMNFWRVTHLVASFNTVHTLAQRNVINHSRMNMTYKDGHIIVYWFVYETWARYTDLNCIDRSSEVHTLTWVVEDKQNGEWVKMITFIVRSGDSRSPRSTVRVEIKDSDTSKIQDWFCLIIFGLPTSPCSLQSYRYIRANFGSGLTCTVLCAVSICNRHFLTFISTVIIKAKEMHYFSNLFW